MAEELRLTQIPSEGLRSYSKYEWQRNKEMEFWQNKGMEVQPWVAYLWTGQVYYGFSYNKKYRLSQKQKDEFGRLKDEISGK